MPKLIGKGASTMTKRAEDQFKRLTEKFTSMEQMVSALTEDQLNYKFNPDTWSIIEVIQHLLLAEGGTYRYISKKILDPSKLDPIGLGTKIREFKLNTYIKTPIKLPAPEIVQPKQGKLPQDYTDLINEWKKVRKALYELLLSLDQSMWSKEIHKHPLVGRISLKGSLNFIELHFDRHQKQIKTLIRKSIDQ